MTTYSGDVWVLIDGQSFSATAECCSIARYLNRGQFIGEETGGAYGGNTSGEQRELTLPDSGIKVLFGKWQYNMAVKPARDLARGILPDHEVLLSANDLLKQHDSQLEYAIKLTQRKK